MDMDWLVDITGYKRIFRVLERIASVLSYCDLVKWGYLYHQKRVWRSGSAADCKSVGP